MSCISFFHDEEWVVKFDKCGWNEKNITDGGIFRSEALKPIWGWLKNNPIKQGKVFAEYEKLCGVYHGNHQKVNPQNVDSLTQEQIAKELGVIVDSVPPS